MAQSLRSHDSSTWFHTSPRWCRCPVIGVGVIFAIVYGMKSLRFIFLQACLLILAACGPKGPRVMQKEGFTLIYDTLKVDVSGIDHPDMSLHFVEAVPLKDGYLCAFEQWTHGHFASSFVHSSSIRRHLLIADRRTAQTHIVDFPYKNELNWSIQEKNGAVYMNYPEWCDTMWRFIPERETWEDATEYRDVVYEDGDYRIYSKGMHFARDHTWIMDKQTGEQYFFPVAAGQVLRFNGYFYFTDLARFRGLTDPKVGVLCDSLSDYAATIADPHPFLPPTLRPRAREMKVFGTIYAFGEGDDGYKGCEEFWHCPDTVFNASFKAQKALYQIVTDPETTWIAQVTGQGLKRIVDLGKHYDAHRIGQTMLYYEDDDANVGIIELGDTLRFHHLHF